MTCHVICDTIDLHAQFCNYPADVYNTVFTQSSSLPCIIHYWSTALLELRSFMTARERPHISTTIMIGDERFTTASPTCIVPLYVM